MHTLLKRFNNAGVGWRAADQADVAAGLFVYSHQDYAVRAHIHLNDGIGLVLRVDCQFLRNLILGRQIGDTNLFIGVLAIFVNCPK